MTARLITTILDFGVTTGMQRSPVAQNTSPIHVLLVGSVSGDKVEPAIYAATIEKLRRTAVPVHLDCQHGAFHGTNPELGCQ
jgi:hypothetical protein